MMLIYAVAVMLFVLLLFVSRKEETWKDRETDRMRRIFLKPASWIERRLIRPYVSGRGRSGGHRASPASAVHTDAELELLYPSRSGEVRHRFLVERISAVLFILCLGILLSGLLYLSEGMNGRLSRDGRVRRNSYGEGSVLLRLEADMGEEKEELEVEIGERIYTDGELEKLEAAAAFTLAEGLAGENGSLDEVRSRLHMPREAEGFPFLISWESSNYELVQSDGSVNCADVDEKGEIVELTAVLTCQEREWVECYTVRICPPVLTPEEALRRNLLQEIGQADEKAAADESFPLPQEVDGRSVAWTEIKEYSSLWILLAFLAAGAVQFWSADSELRKRIQERDRQLLLSYSEFISKLTLLMGAGLPVRAAFARMAEDYRKKGQKPEKIYVYEEILLACREMESGVMEIQAYEHFGARCRLPQYRKCSSLLIRNVRKGSAGTLEALWDEAERSYEERKRNAREEGEKAGTKLLAPMLMMLAVVMVLIMVPACFSFAGL